MNWLSSKPLCEPKFYVFFSELSVTSGPRVKLAGCKSALNPPLVYSTDCSKAVVPALVLLFVALWLNLRGGLFYVLPYVILFLCFSVLLALWLPRFWKRELVLVCSICACLILSGSSSSWCLGRAMVCDCGIPWTFLLPFLSYTHSYMYSRLFCFKAKKWEKEKKFAAKTICTLKGT